MLLASGLNGSAPPDRLAEPHFAGIKTNEMIKLMGLGEKKKKEKSSKLWENAHSRNINVKFQIATRWYFLSWHCCC
jgi:hypothetical protein